MDKPSGRPSLFWSHSTGTSCNPPPITLPITLPTMALLEVTRSVADSPSSSNSRNDAICGSGGSSKKNGKSTQLPNTVSREMGSQLAVLTRSGTCPGVRPCGTKEKLPSSCTLWLPSATPFASRSHSTLTPSELVNGETSEPRTVASHVRPSLPDGPVSFASASSPIAGAEGDH